MEREGGGRLRKWWWKKCVSCGTWAVWRYSGQSEDERLNVSEQTKISHRSNIFLSSFSNKNLYTQKIFRNFFRIMEWWCDQKECLSFDIYINLFSLIILHVFHFSLSLLLFSLDSTSTETTTTTKTEELPNKSLGRITFHNIPISVESTR